MQTGKYCPQHPTRRSLHACRRCGKPVCDACEKESGGRFCTAQCAAQFREFQETVHDEFKIKKSRFSPTGCLRSAATTIILLIIIWAALTQLSGTTDPAQMWAELQRMLRLLF